MTHYHVTAVKWPLGWELHINDGTRDVGVTQSRTLDDAERMVRDYLACDEAPEPVEVTVTPRLAGDLAEVVDAEREAAEDKDRAWSRHTETQARAARVLRDGGISVQDIHTILKLSVPRIYQILKK